MDEDKLWFVCDRERGQVIFGPTLDGDRALGFAQATEDLLVSVPATVEWRPVAHWSESRG